MNFEMNTRAADDHADLLRLLQRVHSYSITTKCDLAREYADEIAAAASRGFISVLVVPGGSIYGRRWKVTTLGLAYLQHEARAILEEEEVKFLRKVGSLTG
jgi:hypothetical protein